MPSAEQLAAFDDIASSTLGDLHLTLNESFDQGIDIDTCRSSIDNLATAAEIVDLQAIGELCKAYGNQVLHDQKETLVLSPEISTQVINWSNHLIALIRNPSDPALIEKVVECLPASTQQKFIEDFLALPSDQSETEQESAHLEHDLLDHELLVHDLIETSITDLADNNKSSINESPISLFVHELIQLEPKLDNIISELVTAEPAATTDFTTKYQENLKRIKETANILGLAGIEVVTDFLISNIQLLDPNSDWHGSVWLELLSPTTALIIDFLTHPEDPNKLIDLIGHLENDEWPQAMTETQSHQLVQLLSHMDVLEFEEDMDTATKLIAEPADVHLPERRELVPELLSAFLHDVPHQAEALNHCVSSLAADEFLKDNLENAQRLTHTIKGAANVVDIPGIANLAHHMEEVFDHLYDQPDKFNYPLAMLLQEACDHIETMIDYLKGQDEKPDSSVVVLQQLLDIINTDSHDEPVINFSTLTTGKPALTRTEEITTTFPSTNESKETVTEETTANETTANETMTGETIAEESIQVSTKVISELFETVEELTISLIHTREQVKQMIENGNSLNQQDEKIQKHRFELEKLVDIKALASAKKRSQISDTATAEDFDSLEMDQYDELHGSVHSFIETVTDSRELTYDMQEQLLSLDGLFVKQMRLNKELQRLTKSTRMVAVANIASRLQRCVRHAARLTQKQVELQFFDNGLQLDEEILIQLTDPIMHLLRNAVDHGIELKSTRLQAEKSPVGQINVHFQQIGNNISVVILDDGEGIDLDKVRASAIKKGFANEHDILDQQQTLNLLLQSGFSTREQANQISGRGVGLDVVNTNIKHLHGTLHIETETGIGTQISLSVPITHLSTHAIIVTLNYDRYAIPSQSLAQLLPPHSGEILDLGGTKGFRYHDTLYPLYTLGNIIYGSSNLNKQDLILKSLPVLLVNSGDTTIALAVDSILSSQEIIVKPISKMIEKIKGVQGVATIADGSFISVLEVSELIEKQLNQDVSTTPSKTTPSTRFGITEERQTTGTKILIADDSLSVRRSLEQLMRDTGYSTFLARDGLHALEIMKDITPDIILTDMEMPRMNGLELSAKIKRSDAWQHIPVVMITSRSTQKHRQLAQQSGVDHYLTKPYTETQLLDLVLTINQQAGRQNNESNYS